MLDFYNYWISAILMMVGFFGIISSTNLVKKLMALSIFQVSVLLFYISVGYVKNAAVPIINAKAEAYVSPVPHVLMLTAIVVGVAVTAVGLALAVLIKKRYGTIEEDEISAMDIRLTPKLTQVEENNAS